MNESGEAAKSEAYINIEDFVDPGHMTDEVGK